ncbi:MAG: ABC transporter ATP-binding protein, partial [Mycobacteriaceae bacterium]|nr:ABC transporter ATP-binding protein [Mycobacteriaceae bacterium]
MSAVAAVELCDLAIGYRRRRGRATTVAAGLRAIARRGELTALLGPNGCGKSTLIRTLCGVQPVLDGGVLLDGVDLTRMSRADCAQRVAVVLTDRVDPGLLSVRELVGLGRIPHVGLTARLSADDHAIVEWALDAVQARYLAARPAAQLSDGERQRVLTARALAQQTALLILDEPTAFLDVAARVGLVEMLRGLAREHGLAVIISTHELELALRVADRVWLLETGGVLHDAIPEELLLAGRLGALVDATFVDRDTLRFDPTDGAFVFSGTSGRHARIEAPEPLGGMLQRVLSRENWRRGEPAEIVITATRADAITVHTGTHPAALTTLNTLPMLLRTLAVRKRTCLPAAETVAALSEVSAIGPFFTIGTGLLAEDGWLPVRRLYTDTRLLAGIIATVQDRIYTRDRRV